MSLRTIRSGSGHRYELDGDPVPGVTTILQAFPKPALVGWSATESANVVLNRWDELEAMKPAERFRTVRDARYTENRAATMRGRDVHAYGEKLAHGQPVDIPERHADLLGYVESYARFLDAHNVRPLHTELPVASRPYRYAGTLDLIATLDDGARWLLDIKTMKDRDDPSAVWPEHVLQTAAYRHASLAVVDGDELEMPAVDKVGIVNVKSDGALLVPVAAGAPALKAFRYVYEVWRYLEHAREYVGAPIYPDEPGAVTYKLERIAVAG